jgi:hypothetical protein
MKYITKMLLMVYIWCIPLYCFTFKTTPPTDYLHFLDKYKHDEYHHVIREVSKEEALYIVKEMCIENIELNNCIKKDDVSRQWLLNNIESDNHTCYILKDSVLCLCRMNNNTTITEKNNNKKHVILSVEIITCIDVIMLYYIQKSTLLETLHGFKYKYTDILLKKKHVFFYIQTHDAEYNNDKYLSTIKNILNVYNK